MCCVQEAHIYPIYPLQMVAKRILEGACTVSGGQPWLLNLSARSGLNCSTLVPRFGLHC